MRRPEAVNTILTHFITNWDLGTYSTIPVIFDNDETEIPNNTSWVRLGIKFSPSKRTTIAQVGNRKFGRFGFVSFQVFILGGSGTYEGDNICEAIADVFEGKKVGSLIDFTECSWSPTGKSDIWYQYNGTIDFSFDDIK